MTVEIIRAMLIVAFLDGAQTGSKLLRTMKKEEPKAIADKTQEIAKQQAEKYLNEVRHLI